MTDIPLCVIQKIIDHPRYAAVTVARGTGLSAMTILRLKNELGIKARAKADRYKPDPAAIAMINGWDVEQTAAALERHGHDLGTRMVLKLCGKKPWGKKQVRAHVQKLKEATSGEQGTSPNI